MKGSMKEWAVFVIIAIIAMFISATTSIAQAPNLFSHVDAATVSADSRATASLEKIKARKTVAEVGVVRVNVSLLKDSKEPINLNLFPDREFSAVLERIDKRGENDISWVGKLVGKTPGSVTFVVRDGNITGMIRPGSQIYSVESLGGGLHAVIRIDPSRFPPDHPPSFEEKTRRDSKLKLARTEFKLIRVSVLNRVFCIFYPKRCLTTINVIVAYTASAKAQVTDIDALIQLAVDEANTSYANSDISLRLSLVYKYQISYTESGSYDMDLDRFRTPGDTYMDDIHTLRDTYKADVAVLIFNNADYCGLASTILADATTAFAVVHYDCATGYFSFAHEIGHLQGARHNCEMDPTTTPFDYGHGYLYALGSWRTIMAYNSSSCSGGSCTRIQYWSNPNKSYGGVPMGTTCSATVPCCADNHRVLNETRGTVAGFR
jgi:hypothetical protein